MYKSSNILTDLDDSSTTDVINLIFVNANPANEAQKSRTLQIVRPQTLRK